jgi:hypothetical protein
VKNLKVGVFIGLVLWFGSECVQASASTGSEMVSYCAEAVKSADGEPPTGAEGLRAAFCLGVIDGVLAGSRVVGALHGEQLICVPPEFDNGQLARIVVKQMKDNPQLLKYEGALAVAMSIRSAFPCGSR